MTDKAYQKAKRLILRVNDEREYIPCLLLASTHPRS